MRAHKGWYRRSLRGETRKGARVALEGAGCKPAFPGIQPSHRHPHYHHRCNRRRRCGKSIRCRRHFAATTRDQVQ